ncbi:hypothetical protein CCHR01_06456 [Colletotrichum chrysophilum]|uniref:Uncharacterized protein n=1 Tax=Colletotrichum chrysophilum TaxID=1836956 RepID=A0AAD9EGS2_9PEZI|nr:hypothetical protein CCHR01_06456 [Colletotrichum chrysophilum]
METQSKPDFSWALVPVRYDLPRLVVKRGSRRKGVCTEMGEGVTTSCDIAAGGAQ